MSTIKRARSEEEEEEPEWIEEEEDVNASNDSPAKRMKVEDECDEDDDVSSGPSSYVPSWDDLAEGGEKNWRRPALPNDLNNSSRLAVQCLDCDYTITKDPVYSMTSHQQKQAQIRLFGINDAGNSVMLYIHNFISYFYVQALNDDVSQNMLRVIHDALDAQLRDANRVDKDLTRFVLRVECVKRQSVWGYHPRRDPNDPDSDKVWFYKIHVAIPALVATARRICEKGFNIHNVGFKSFQTYESNLPYVLRFMVDKNIRGGGWVEVPAGKWFIRNVEHRSEKHIAVDPKRLRDKISHCQLEVDVDWADVIGHNPDGEWLKMAPVRILSFDIECAGRRGFFPEAEKDPVIQIASVVSLQSNPSVPIIKNIFTLNTCASIVGAQVIGNQTEQELLMNWLKFFLTCDADIITGYNIVNFDLPYLLDRAKALKLKDFPFLGRIRTSQTTVKNSKFESKAFGQRESKEIKIEGRVQFDLLDVIRREYKLRSYTLNSVCAHFLNNQKEDVHYSIISDLQNGTDETRRRLAVYCLKDALLPLELLEKLMLIVNYVEMARVTGVPISFLLTRGQQIKVVSQLYRKAREHGLVVPVRHSTPTDEKYEGATVIEPVKGYYTVPIATLDFASLYPSIMQAHNLCIAAGTLVALTSGVSKPIEQITVGDEVYGLADPLGVTGRKVTNAIYTGERDCIELLFDDGRNLVCTPDHRILATTGEFIEADKLVVGVSSVVVKAEVVDSGDAVTSATLPTFSVKLIRKHAVGTRQVYDLTVPNGEGVEPSFCAAGIVVHNCYSTLIGHQDLPKIPKDHYQRTPTGDFFIKKEIRRGILPEILTELLDARSHAKKLMKNAKDPFEAAVLNGRQLALKISANSVYGFTGAQVGQLPCLQISSSVTGYGREMIHHTKSVVEKRFRIENGYKYNSEVIYGDTDSVMIKFGCDNVAEAMQLGAEAAQLVTKEFINPIRLEFEKVYFPYLLMNKKRYAGLYWTRPDKWDKMDTKGIETVRRDSCALVQNVVTQCLNFILMERSADLAINYVKNIISDLLCNRLDLSLLVISKALAKSEYAGKQAHVELAERMKKRDPRTAPVTGDRVAYVITQQGKDAKAYEKAEDPIYVLENDMPIDTQYYLKNQLEQPLTRIFEPILGEGNTSQLFNGEHTRKIKVLAPSSAGGIMKFAVKIRTCIGCKATLKPAEQVVCAHCSQRQAQLYMRQIEKVRDFEMLFTKVWTQCQRCQGSLHQDVLCSSRDCPIFYRRKKVQKDLNEAQTLLNTFSF